MPPTDHPHRRPLPRIVSLPGLLSLLAAVGLLAFLATRVDIDLGTAWNQARSAEPGLMAAALAVHYASFAFRGARWRLLLQNSAEPGAPPQDVPSMLYCSQLILLASFVNSIGWFHIGDAYRIYIYQEENKGTLATTAGTMLAERALDAAIVAATAAVTIPLLTLPGTGGGTRTVLLTSAGLLALTAAALAVMAATQDILPRQLPEWLTTRYRQFRGAALSGLKRMPQTTALGLLGWAAEAGRMYLVSEALGLHLNPALAVFLTLANSLLSLVPTPGGIGAVEPGLTSLAAAMGPLTRESAAALVLVDRLISYVSVIATGAAVLTVRSALRSRNQPPQGP